MNAGCKLAVQAVALMAEHVSVYGQFGSSILPASMLRDPSKQIDRGLFQQVWSLLESKQFTTVDAALSEVGLQQTVRPTFMEECSGLFIARF